MLTDCTASRETSLPSALCRMRRVRGTCWSVSASLHCFLKIFANEFKGAFIRHGLTQRECETEALFQVVAGSDTTATAIRATMLYVVTTPRVYQKLQHEIDVAIREGRISSPILSAEGEKLPYLQVC
jgi:hypothetical protein